jgi:hypothetical protein
MEELKVTIEGVEYTIDIEKAKSLGVLKQDAAIKKIEVGDLYLLANVSPLIIVEHGFASLGSGEAILYNFIGLWSGLQTYSDFPHGATEEEMLAFLNEGIKSKELKFIKNIDIDFTRLIESVVKS